MTGIELIAQERKEQLEKHEFSIERDIAWHKNGQLVDAAMQYLGTDLIDCYPEDWDRRWYKSENPDWNGNRIDELKIAGALIAAEIDRIINDDKSDP